jgi:hypothetical protein
MEGDGMNTKTTPGPWRTADQYLNHPDNARVDILAAPKSDIHSGTKVAEATYSPRSSAYHVDNREEAEANARLIAAAPDLLKALNAMLTHMGMDEDDCNKLTFDQARAAISKATGEQK